VKKFILIVVTLCIMIGLVGCSSTHPQGDASTKVSNNITTFTKQNWYVTKQSYNGTLFSYTVHLQISGNSTASSLAVATTGNGLITEKPIKVINGVFNQDVVIAFYMLSAMNINPNYSTSVKVISNYNDLTTQLEILKSPVLDFSKAQVVGS